MKELYITIMGGEDGLYIEKVNDMEELLKEAVEEEYKFLSDFPQDQWNKKRDIMDRENQPNDGEIILMKVTIIKPKLKKVVTQYAIEDEE
jgi:hypothetical protein